MDDTPKCFYFYLHTVFPPLNAHPLLSAPSNKRPSNLEMLEISAPF